MFYILYIIYYLLLIHIYNVRFCVCICLCIFVCLSAPWTQGVKLACNKTFRERPGCLRNVF